jgi:hypothetical protein
VTSAALTRKLAPHLDGYYDAIYSKTGGNVKKASQEDKYHDIAFQRFAEGTNTHEYRMLLLLVGHRCIRRRSAVKRGAVYDGMHVFMPLYRFK